MTTKREGSQADEVLRTNWRDDDQAAMILKAATSPLGTQNFAQIQSTKVVPMLGAGLRRFKALGLGEQI
jgi:hypothetical protein